MSHAWYAVRVRSSCEHNTARFLSASDQVVFLPTYRDRRQWSDRAKEVEVPLFAGYVFCQMDIQKRLPVLQSPGVIDIVSFGKTFIPIAEEEIDAVKRIVNSSAFAGPCPYLNVGDKVTVHRGPLAGLDGILVEMKNEHRLIVSVHLLQRSIAAEIDLDCVKPVNPRFHLPMAPLSQNAVPTLV